MIFDDKIKYKTIRYPNFWLQFSSLENGSLTVKYLPYRNDWIERNLFADKHKHELKKCCPACKTSHTELQYQIGETYITKYKHLPHNWLYDNIFDMQIALYELTGHWLLEYNIIGNKYDRLNFEQEFDSKDGWFQIKIQLNKN